MNGGKDTVILAMSRLTRCVCFILLENKVSCIVCTMMLFLISIVAVAVVVSYIVHVP